MKKHTVHPFRFLLPILTIFLINSSTAQDCDVLFYYFEGGSTQPVLMDLTDDGGYIIAGSDKQPGTNAHNIQVVKVDQFGNETWSNLFGTIENEVAVDVEVLDNNEELNSIIEKTHQGRRQKSR